MSKLLKKKKLKVLTITGGVLLLGSIVAASLHSLTFKRTNPVLSPFPYRLNHQQTEKAIDLGPTRVFQNTSFSGITVNGLNPGAAVLTEPNAVRRTDFFGNVLWTFAPNSLTNTKATKISSDGTLIKTRNGDLDTINTIDFTQDISNKTVVEVRQDASLSNIFYLLLIPTNFAEITPSVSEIEADSSKQATVVVLSEDLSTNNSDVKYGIVAVSNIKPSDMTKNYPSQWKSMMTSFTKTNHPSYFDTETGEAISLPWKVYLTTVGNLYADNGQIAMAGGNGTMFSGKVEDEEILSMGMFRINFDFNQISQKSGDPQLRRVSADGFPYATLLSGLAAPIVGSLLPDNSKKSYIIGSELFNLPIGQNNTFAYVPRIAVSGLVPAVEPGSETVNSWNLVGAITIGTKTDENKSKLPEMRTNKQGAITKDDLGSNHLATQALKSPKATGNSFTTQTIFSTLISITAFQTLASNTSADTNNTINPIEHSAVASPTQFTTGTVANAWKDNSENQKTFAMNYFYSLVNVGGFSPRSIGNLVAYTNKVTNSKEFSLRAYVFQLGSFMIKLYHPGIIPKDVMSSIPMIVNNGDFATVSSSLSSATKAYKWNNFLGSFIIGGDANPKNQSAVVGSGWSTVKTSPDSPESGVYYSRDLNTNNEIMLNNNKVIRPTATNNNNNAFPDFNSGITQAMYNSGNGSRDQENGRIAKIPINTDIRMLNVPNGINSVFSSNSSTSAFIQQTNRMQLDMLGLNNGSLSLVETNPQESKLTALGQGRFFGTSQIDQSFFTNSINDVLTDLTVDGKPITILNPRFRSLIFNYINRPTYSGFDFEKDFRILATKVDRTAERVTFVAQVRNPFTQQFVTIPLPSSNLVNNSASFDGGFGQLPLYVTPVAIAVPLVVVAIVIGLGLGIGIPMQKNKKALQQGFDISHRKVDVLTTAVGSVFKQIINRTQIGNIKKTPQLLKKGTTPTATKPSAPTPTRPIAPKKPTVPTPGDK